MGGSRLGGLAPASRRPYVFLSLPLLLGSFGCQSPPLNDLRINEALYRSPGSVAKLPPDPPALLAPLADERTAPIADAGAPSLPITTMPEGLWARPLPEMIDGVLRAEIEKSRVFAAVLPQARADALVVKPTLTMASAAIQEHPQGRRS